MLCFIGIIMFFKHSLWKMRYRFYETLLDRLALRSIVFYPSQTKYLRNYYKETWKYYTINTHKMSTEKRVK